MASTGASTSSAHSEPPPSLPPNGRHVRMVTWQSITFFLARLGVHCTPHYSLFITRPIGEKGEIYDGSRQVGNPDF